MQLKTLITQYCQLVIMNNIATIEIVEADDYYGEDRGSTLAEIEYVLVAKDTNNNEIHLGNYRSQSICEDLIDNIAEWISSDNDMPVYRLWLDYPEFYPLLYDLKK